ncbi:hypothetical protein KBD59_02745 [Candidatus Gracilibacteria bacterium]|nr:hypothetical protein [Candidatus Gracilibacteria bacterium]
MARLTREVARKCIHLLGLPIIFGYIFLAHYFSHRVGILGLTGLLLLLLEFEYLRIDLQIEMGNEITNAFSRLFLRKHERNNVVSSVFFIVACIVAFSAFDYPIALTALLMTVFGDMSSAIFGVAYGKQKIFRSKSYIGSFAGLITNILVALGMMYYFPGTIDLVLALSMAATATIVETITKKLDDNLTVPLFTGFLGQAIVFWHKFL